MDKAIIKTKTKDLLQILKMVKGAVRGLEALLIGNRKLEKKLY
jgi:hypothetical protein